MTTSSAPSSAPSPDADGSKPLANVRWEAFCVAYTGHCRRNAAGAYVAAGYKPKTPGTAAVNAGRLLTNANIAARVEHLNNEALKIERLHARDAVRRLAIIATAELADFLNDDGTINPESLKGPMGAAIESFAVTETPTGRRWTIRLKDSMRALELLGLTEKAAPSPGQGEVFVIEI